MIFIYKIGKYGLDNTEEELSLVWWLVRVSSRTTTAECIDLFSNWRRGCALWILDQSKPQNLIAEKWINMYDKCSR